MTAPRSLGDKMVRSLPDLLAFANQLWLPDYRLLRRKLAAMLGSPAPFALPFWDGAAWHAVQLGSLGPDLPDAAATIDIALGNQRVAREGTLTGDRVYGFSGADLYDAAVVWNLTTAHTCTLTLSSGDMALPPMYVGFARYDPMTVAWVGERRMPVRMDPELF